MAKEQERTDKERDGKAEQACARCEEYLSGWKRAHADYANLQKELSQERASMRLRAKEDAVQSLLPVLDNFDAAVKFQPDGLDETAKGWLSGILHVRNQLEEVLRELGAESFGAAGDAFDPNKHEAAEKKSDEGAADQEILEVLQRGWQMGEKVVRPAKVIVNTTE